MRILPAGDCSVLVVFGTSMSFENQRAVHDVFRLLHGLQDKRIRNLHPGYVSLLIDFDPLLSDHEDISRVVIHATTDLGTIEQPAGREVIIPVCYEGALGPDLGAVAEQTGISTERVIRLHSSVKYLVAFLGFSPGFGYLSGLPQELSVPRRAIPRKRVVAGSVGIAGQQTGIYPITSPGGWQLIGRTPMRMFEPDQERSARLQPGDSVQFRPISLDEFHLLSNQEGTSS